MRTDELSDLDYVFQLLDMEPISAAQLVEFTDSHGGIHGDGSCWAVLHVSTPEFTHSTRFHDWRDTASIGDLVHLPLPERLPFELENSRFWFRDFQKEIYPGRKQIEKPPHQRSSYNFVMAVYNPEAEELYVFNLDT